MGGEAEPEIRTGAFIDPLKDWPNDDLLLHDEARARLQTTHQRLVRVLDWPELRAAFTRHDAPASRGKRASHRQGLLAITFAGLGVVLLGAIPALPREAEPALSTIALVFMSVGGGLGVAHWLVLRSRTAWLGHRFWTERLRQLYFQSIVNTLPLMAAAITDDGSTDFDSFGRCG